MLRLKPEHPFLTALSFGDMVGSVFYGNLINQNNVRATTYKLAAAAPGPSQVPVTRPQRLRLPVLPPPPQAPSRNAVSGFLTNKLNRGIHATTSSIPALAKPIQALQHGNQVAGNWASSAREAYATPVIDAIDHRLQQYFPKVPTHVNLTNIGLDTGVTPAEAYSNFKALRHAKPYLDWKNNITSGIQDVVDSTIPAIGQYNAVKKGISDTAVSAAGNWARSKSPNVQQALQALEKFKDYEKVPLIQRILGLTKKRPVVPDLGQFIELQNLLNNPVLNRAAIHGLMTDGDLRHDVVLGALNPLTVGDTTMTAGRVLSRAADGVAAVGAKLPPAVMQMAASNPNTAPISTLLAKLPALSNAGRAITTVGKGVTAAGLLGNIALEIPRIMNSTNGFGTYVQDNLARQTLAETPLATVNLLVNNLNSPIATLSGVGKLLTDKDTYRGIWEYLHPMLSGLGNNMLATR